LAAAASLAIAFAPPDVGRTMLVPLDGRTINQVVLERSALTRLAPGPLPGSIIVEGKGRVLASALFSHGIIMLGAPAAICGEPQRALSNG
jgi:hypothetical protein